MNLERISSQSGLSGANTVADVAILERMPIRANQYSYRLLGEAFTALKPPFFADLGGLNMEPGRLVLCYAELQADVDAHFRAMNRHLIHEKLTTPFAATFIEYFLVPYSNIGMKSVETRVAETWPIVDMTQNRNPLLQIEFEALETVRKFKVYGEECPRGRLEALAKKYKKISKSR